MVAMIFVRRWSGFDWSTTEKGTHSAVGSHRARSLPVVRTPRPNHFARRLAVPLVALGLLACGGDDGGVASPSATSAGPGSTTSTTFVPPSIPSGDRAAVCDADRRILEADIEISALLGPALDAEDSPDADALLLRQLPKTEQVADRAADAYDELARILPAPLDADATAIGGLTRVIYEEVAKSRSIDEVIVVIEIAQKEYAESLDAAQRLSDTLRATCGVFTPTPTTAGVAAPATTTR